MIGFLAERKRETETRYRREKKEEEKGGYEHESRDKGEKEIVQQNKREDKEK